MSKKLMGRGVHSLEPISKNMHVRAVLSVLVSLALILSFIPKGIGFAAGPSAPGGGNWTSEDTITVEFGQPINLATDAKSKIFYSQYGTDVPLQDNDVVSTEGNNLKLKVDGGYTYAGKYSALSIKAGAVSDSSGVSNSDITAYLTVNANPESATSTQTSISSDGGNVDVTVKGSLVGLDENGFTWRLNNKAGQYDTVRGNAVKVDANTLKVTFTLDKNESGAQKTYVLQYRAGMNGAYSEFTPTFSLIQAAAQTEPAGDPEITSVTPDKTELDSNGGEININVVGINLVQNETLMPILFTANPSGGWVKYTDSDATITWTVNSSTVASSKLVLPANTTNSDIKYRVRIQTGKNGSAPIYATQDAQFTVKAKTVDPAPGPGPSPSTDPTLPDGASTFIMEPDDMVGYKISAADSTGIDYVIIQLKEGFKLRSDVEARYCIYFTNSLGGEVVRSLTENDVVEAIDNQIKITFTDKSVTVPYYVAVKPYSIINDNGAYVKRALGSQNDPAAYLKSGAHISEMAYSAVTLDSNGGEVTATIKGTNLTSSIPSLSVEVYRNNEKASTGGTETLGVGNEPDIAATNYVKSLDVAQNGISATVVLQLPANDTEKTISYRVIPKLNGINTYPTYITNYDVISVLPKGKSADDITLSCVDINGASDTDPRAEVMETTIDPSAGVSTKIQFIIRGTNLSSKKAGVKITDENGIDWPCYPVFECGATIRWQNSALFLPERTSKNEQAIEMLIPRGLGTDHTFTIKVAPDGVNYINDLVGTVIVHNNGSFDPSDGFTLDELTQVKDLNVNYLDEQGNAVSIKDTYKVYGCSELYNLGIAAKNIPGYELVSSNPSKTLLDLYLATPEIRDDGYYQPGAYFAKALNGQDIQYVYRKVSDTPENPSIGGDTVSDAPNGQGGDATINTVSDNAKGASSSLSSMAKTGDENSLMIGSLLVLTLVIGCCTLFVFRKRRA